MVCVPPKFRYTYQFYLRKVVENFYAQLKNLRVVYFVTTRRKCDFMMLCKNGGRRTLTYSRVSVSNYLYGTQTTQIGASEKVSWFLMVVTALHNMCDLSTKK